MLDLLHLRTDGSERNIICWVLKKDSIIAITSYCFWSRIKVVLRGESNTGRVVVAMLDKHLFHKRIFVQIQHEVI